MSRARVPIRPARDQVISSQQDMNSKLTMLDIMPSQKVEIKEEEAPIESSFQPTTLSPRGGQGFNNLTADWPFADSMYKTQYGGAARHLSSLGSQQDSRPNSQGQQIPDSKSPRIINRAIKLKDDLASVMRSSGDRNGVMHRTLMDFNQGRGQILNYKVANGINDQSMRGSFRKWTGMPQTTRPNKIPALPLN